MNKWLLSTQPPAPGKQPDTLEELVEFVAETGADINQVPFGVVWAWVQDRVHQPQKMRVLQKMQNSCV